MSNSIRRIALVSIVVAGAQALASCSEFLASGCAGVGYNAVRITVRDDVGNPQALGAVIELFDGSYYERQAGTYSPSIIEAAGGRGGRTYDIRVTKQYYQDVWVRDVRAPGGGCVSRAVSVEVPVVLSLLPSAPAVRSIHLLPEHVLLDRAPYTTSFAFTPYVDASRGTSQALAWRITGDTASVSFDPATGSLRYRCLPKSGYLTIIATSLVDPSISDSADVAVQGHPAATNDPPCS